MQTITTVGLDIAKSVFQVHGVDADGQVVVRRSIAAVSSASSPPLGLSSATIASRKATAFKSRSKWVLSVL